MEEAKAHGGAEHDAAGHEADKPKRARRADQKLECPKCRGFMVPATASRGYPAGRKRYRTCSGCGWVFTTWQPHDGEERVSG